MKTRQGFVSNSSSSSFMIFGKWLEEIPENINELRKKGFQYYESEDSGPCIGVEFDINDDETFGHYKQKIADMFTNAGLPTEVTDITLCYGSY